MFNFLVGLKWQLIVRSFGMKTCLVFQIFPFPRQRGDRPVVSDTF